MVVTLFSDSLPLKAVSRQHGFKFFVAIVALNHTEPLLALSQFTKECGPVNPDGND